MGDPRKYLRPEDTAPIGQGLKLTPEFRRRMEADHKMRIQPPTEQDQRDFDKRISGLPGDVLLTLESIRLLADQGNRIAEWLYVRECKKLGIWYDRKIWMAGG